MLGQRPDRACSPRAGRAGHRPDPGTIWTSRTRRRSGGGAGRPSRTSWSTAPRGPRSTTPRRTRTRRWPSTGTRVARTGGRVRRPGRRPGAGVHRLRLRRRGPSAVPEDAVPAPRTAYGRTKLAGEQAVRAACPTPATSCGPPGCTAPTGRTSSHTMIRLARSGAARRSSTTSAASPPGPPTSRAQIHALITDRRPGRRLPRDEFGETTWFGLAARSSRSQCRRARARIRRRSAPVPTTSAAYQRPAPRPAYSVLGHDGVDGRGHRADRRLAGSARTGRFPPCWPRNRERSAAT